MKKLTEKQLQAKIKSGVLSPSEIISLYAQKSGDPNAYRLSLRVDYPERYPEYSEQQERV